MADTKVNKVSRKLGRSWYIGVLAAAIFKNGWSECRRWSKEIYLEWWSRNPIFDTKTTDLLAAVVTIWEHMFTAAILKNGRQHLHGRNLRWSYINNKLKWWNLRVCQMSCFYHKTHNSVLFCHISAGLLFLCITLAYLFNICYASYVNCKEYIAWKAAVSTCSFITPLT